MDLLLKNIAMLATPLGKSARRGREQGDVKIIKDAMIGVKNGKIAYAGEADESLRATQAIDCAGKLVTPGLVDAHTHLVFGGWRQHELGLKLKGVPYLDILKQGGGILSTVRSTRAESEGALFEKGREILNDMLRHGTTTCEAKSGYGLDLESEMKQLRVIKRLNGLNTVNIAATFLGAHAVPEEYKHDRKKYIRLVTEEMMPAVKAEGLAEFSDVFCETAVFDVEESEHIIKAAQKNGFQTKIHGDEIDPVGGAELAARTKCISAEHLIQASDRGIADMAEAGVAAVLLPATSFYLDKNYARARKMIEEGVTVAVATDFNPGSSPNLNLQIAMNLACIKYRMTPEEALTAVTLNAAAAIGRSDTAGSLETGKNADIVIWDAPDLNYIFYRYGSNLVRNVIKDGRVVV